MDNNNLIDFEKEFSDFEKVYLTREKVKENIGKYLIYVDRVDPHRGYYSITGGTIDGIRYNRIFLNDYGKEVDLRDIKEAGIKKIKNNEK